MFDYTFQWRPVFAAWPELLSGALITIQITALSMLIGLGAAAFLAICRRSRNRLAYRSATGWVELARNTPALVQIYMAYFGLGAFGLHLSPYTSVLTAISFNNSGYLTEIVRGGLDAVSPQQRNGALSLGMTSFQAYRYVIFPQVLRIVFLPVMNQVVWAMLGSSLGMIIGLDELTGATTFQQSLTFRPFEFYFAAAVAYYLLAKGIILTARLIGVRLFRYQR
jgi:polar amino acid transport system permease protein